MNGWQKFEVLQRGDYREAVLLPAPAPGEFSVIVVTRAGEVIRLDPAR
jgi:hypothetical protein